MIRRMKRTAACLVAALMLAATLGSFGGTALADGSMRRGDEGLNVEELQRLLKKAGCFDYDEITGFYGAATEEGVRKFQSTHGLTVDGVAGDDTVQKLREASESDTSQLKPDSLCLGMSGGEVEDIQKRLQELGLFNDQVTGYFGPKTEAAVLAFQDAAGIKADGIVGQKTKNVLFSDFRSDSLIPGMKGDKVEQLQQRLKDLGYYDADVTGLYGQITQKAVAYFQRLNKLAEDGIAGKKTQAALFDKNAKSEKDAKRSQKYTDVSQQSAESQEKCEALIEYAKTFLGRPYVLGAEGPNSFDCSGLTWYVYKHFGVTLPRHAREQGYGNYGVKITSKDKLMPGDLVFFNSIRSDSDLCDHVAIYIGDMKIIQSPNTGSHVKISSIANARDYSWGRRVFK
jgi:peptidoglycan hydrolase-like protein with peptidoglycan-binding domain